MSQQNSLRCRRHSGKQTVVRPREASVRSRCDTGVWGGPCQGPACGSAAEHAQQQRLKERDRYAEEMTKLRATGEAAGGHRGLRRDAGHRA